MGLTFNMVTSSNSKTKPPVYSYLKADGTAANCELIDEGGGNFMLKLLESGTLNISKLNSAKDGIDVLLVGGGNSNGYHNAGRGGEVLTYGSIEINKDQDYPITIGTPGEGIMIGGTSSTALGYTARAGYGSNPGINGVDPWGIGTKFGAGGGFANYQGTRLNETLGIFQSYTIYGTVPGNDRGDNTGAGGGDGGSPNFLAYSGIVIIRNHRA